MAGQEMPLLSSNNNDNDNDNDNDDRSPNTAHTSNDTSAAAAANTNTTTINTSTDTHPSFGLKIQAFLCPTVIIALILAINLGGIFLLLNLGSSLLYASSVTSPSSSLPSLLSNHNYNHNGTSSSAYTLCTLLAIGYLSVRLLTPGGAWNSQKRPRGGVWRTFNQTYFFPSAIFRRYLNLSFAKPLPTELVEAEQSSSDNNKARFILAAFPHGCNSDFRLLMDGILEEAFPNLVENDKIRSLAASVLFWIPVVREISLWTGCIDASRPVAEAALREGKSLVILPGGEAEQIRTRHGREIVYLKNRKGFVKLALSYHVPIVPMYVFGCSDSYHTYTNVGLGFRLWLVKHLGICITPCSGLWGNPLCPLPKTTTIVVGKPIRFERRKEEQQPPTKEELDRAHAIFIRELVALFDAHKTALGYGDRTLEIV
mmetsp:Transcript_27180/g.59828  ORF Transcript_27180/g.59828 Transcript_27180/m.59828 type:complete len:428 (+) Transcript_27180:186-1469(+)|eukprot:CAMPEP_0168292934 /NCGR_PEP_ID=MMETSP0142_2-20121227/7522_1 /TAXON_ID=44445 /ORGANISM="Pseudo-nitzschia australis, Strain 10249 10 AB" /LENGTH=427 /DNA_ID=CAMNT_0008240893 /DNA_START=164 /DNA_END=1447 /DNA_ORIENTATION=-